MASTIDVLTALKAEVMGLLDEVRKTVAFDPVRSGKVLAYESVLIRIDEAMTAARLAE